MTDDDQPTSSGSGLTARRVAFIVVAVGFAAFVLQNTDDQQVDWLVFNFTMPLWLLVIISALVGAVLYALISWSRRRGD